MLREHFALLFCLAFVASSVSASAQPGHVLYKRVGTINVNADYLGQTFAGCSASLRSANGELRFGLRANNNKYFWFKSPPGTEHPALSKSPAVPIFMMLDNSKTLVFRNHSVPFMFNDGGLTMVAFDAETSAFLETQRSIQIKQGGHILTWNFANGLLKEALLNVWDCVQAKK